MGDVSDVSVGRIIVSPLQRISVTGGDVMHALKFGDPGFVGFGEAYFSAVLDGAVKAWKRHRRMTLNLVVPVGEVRFVFIDDTAGRREETAGADRYVRLTVPPGIWFGFQGLAHAGSLLLNVADIPHDPTEVDRRPADAFMVQWEKQQ